MKKSILFSNFFRIIFGQKIKPLSHKKRLKGFWKSGIISIPCSAKENKPHIAVKPVSLWRIPNES